MNYPYKKLALPTELKSQINGKLPDSLLAKVSIGGRMWKTAAVAFNAMMKEAETAGHTFMNIGDYRSFDSQLKMFKERYSLKDEGRTPQVTRKFEDKTWYLKKGMSPSAAPDPTGKSGSNHGWGLAMDLAVKNKAGDMVNISAAPKASTWICENGPRFGFYLQGSDPKSGEFELWHWQYCEGDAKPPALA